MTAVQLKWFLWFVAVCGVTASAAALGWGMFSVPTNASAPVIASYASPTPRTAQSTPAPLKASDAVWSRPVARLVFDPPLEKPKPEPKPQPAPSPPPTPPPDVKLVGIFQETGQPRGLFRTPTGTEVRAAGEPLKGFASAEIVSIEADHAVLRHTGREVTIELQPRVMATPAKRRPGR